MSVLESLIGKESAELTFPINHIIQMQWSFVECQLEICYETAHIKFGQGGNIGNLIWFNGVYVSLQMEYITVGRILNISGHLGILMK